jgi:nucleotide-binding universal stress UspA family protein
VNAQAVRRILVALDASPHSHAALEEAAALAAGLEAELAGIFVLDTELMRLSALPVAHETGLTSARRRDLDPESMERALRIQADRSRAALEAAAKRHRLQSSFQLSRGNVVSELIEAANRADLMAMGVIGHMGLAGKRLGSATRGVRARSRCSLLLLAPGPRLGESVVVVWSDSEDSVRALELAVELAGRRGSDLVVLLSGENGGWEDVKTEIGERLAGTGGKLIVDEMASGRFDELSGLLGRHRGGLLVVGQDCELVAEHDDELGTLGCPVLLARAARPEQGDTAEG